jgi:hypothetical protein
VGLDGGAMTAPHEDVTTMRLTFDLDPITQ